MRIRFIVFNLALFFAFNLPGQDLHFTQFGMGPLNLNPAMTGAFYGTYRVGGIFRDQWWSVNGNNVDGGSGSQPYYTGSAYIDSPIIRGFRKQDWIGVGFNFIYDRAGTSKLQQQGQLLSLAYHLGLNKKSTSVLTFGAQFGFIQRKFDKEGLKTGFSLANNGAADPILGGFNPDPQSNSDLITTGYNDWAAGVMLTVEANKRTSFRMGHSVAHFIQPSRAFSMGSNVDKIPIRNTTFITMYADVGKRYTAVPSVMFQNMAKNSELVIQFMNKFLIQPENDITFNAGLGFRAANASDLSIIVGMDYKDIRVGLAYDINLTGFTTATSGNGGIELGVSYIGKVYKKPEVKPVLICPRL